MLRVLALVRSLAKFSNEVKPRHTFIFSGLFDENIKNKNTDEFSYFPFPLQPKNLELDIKKYASITVKAPVKNLTEKPKINLDFVNVFIDGMVLVSKALFDLEPKRERVYLRIGKDIIAADWMAVIPLVSTDGKNPQGRMILSIKTKTLLDIYNQVSGASITSITEDVSALLSTAAKQVYGYARRIFNDAGGRFGPAVSKPVSIAAGKLEFSSSTMNMVAEFSSKRGSFFIEIQLPK